MINVGRQFPPPGIYLFSSHRNLCCLMPSPLLHPLPIMPSYLEEQDAVQQP